MRTNYGKALICQGLKYQCNDPKSSDYTERNKKAVQCYKVAIDMDNGVNYARCLIANIAFQDEQYEQASKYYHEINNFIKAETCFKLLCAKNLTNPVPRV